MERALSPEDRRRVIKRIVTDHVVETQNQLLELLSKEGILATQATVSRDIRFLGLVRVANPSGGHRYAVPELPTVTLELVRQKLSDTFVSAQVSGNLIILKLLPGNGQSIAWLLDNLPGYGMTGTVAGNDTILIVMNAPNLAESLLRELCNEASRETI